MRKLLVALSLLNGATVIFGRPCRREGDPSACPQQPPKAAICFLACRTLSHGFVGKHLDLLHNYYYFFYCWTRVLASLSLTTPVSSVVTNNNKKRHTCQHGDCRIRRFARTGQRLEGGHCPCHGPSHQVSLVMSSREIKGHS